MAQSLACVKDLEAHDVAIFVYIDCDALLDVDIIVGLDLANLDVQRVSLGVIFDFHCSPPFLGAFA